MVSALCVPDGPILGRFLLVPCCEGDPTNSKSFCLLLSRLLMILSSFSEPCTLATALPRFGLRRCDHLSLYSNAVAMALSLGPHLILLALLFIYRMINTVAIVSLL